MIITPKIEAFLRRRLANPDVPIEQLIDEWEKSADAIRSLQNETFVDLIEDGIV